MGRGDSGMIGIREEGTLRRELTGVARTRRIYNERELVNGSKTLGADR